MKKKLQTMGKHSNRNRGKKNQQQMAGSSDQNTMAVAKRKKELKVFKLPTDMGKRVNKKAKKVETTLKKVRVSQVQTIRFCPIKI